MQPTAENGIHKAKTDRTTRRNRQIHCYIWRLQSPLSVIDRLRRQKISKNRVKLNSSINQLDLIDTHRVLHPTTVVYILFSNLYGTFTKIDHTLVHKT